MGFICSILVGVILAVTVEVYKTIDDTLAEFARMDRERDKHTR